MLKLYTNIFYTPSEKLTARLEADPRIQPINSGNLKNNKWCAEHCVFEDELEFNIAQFNSILNENTALYATWRNSDILKDCEYVGFQHYRRLFDRNTIDTAEEYDITVAKAHPMQFNIQQFVNCKIPIIVSANVWQGYAVCHNFDDFMEMLHLVSKTKFVTRMEEWSCQPELFAPCNMFIMKKQLFAEYCAWAFPILFTLKDVIDLSGRDNYQKRALAFLSERLFSLFAYTKKAEGLKVREVATEFLYNEKPVDATDKRGEYS